MEVGARGGRPHVANYNAVIGMCCKRRQWDGAVHLLVRLRDIGLQPTVALGALCRGFRADVITFSGASSAWTEAQQWQQALSALSAMDAAGVQEDTISGSTTTKALDAGGLWKKVLHQLDGMHIRALSVDVVSHSAAVSSRARAAQWGSAIAALCPSSVAGGFLVGGQEPNIVTYNAVIDACEKAAQWEQGMSTFQRLRSDGLDPDAISCNGAISACSKHGQSPNDAAEGQDMWWMWAIALLANMLLVRLAADRITCGATVIASSRAHRWSQVLGLLRQLRKLVAQPNAAAFSAAIGASEIPEVSQSWEMAGMILDWLQQHGLGPLVATYNGLISAAGRSQRWKVGAQLLSEMPSKGVLPNAITNNAAIRLSERSEQGDLAWEVLQRMHRSSDKPDLIMYNVAITASEKGQQWKEALHLLCDVANEGMVPDDVSHNAAISASEKGRQWRMAIRLLLVIRENALYPDVISYSACVLACGWEQQWQIALDTLRQGTHKRFGTNAITCQAAVAACEQGQQALHVVGLLHELWRLGSELLSAEHKSEAQHGTPVSSPALLRPRAWKVGGASSVGICAAGAVALAMAPLAESKCTSQSCVRGAGLAQYRRVGRRNPRCERRITLTQGTSVSSAFAGRLGKAPADHAAKQYSTIITERGRERRWVQAGQVLSMMLQQQVRPDVAICTAAASAATKGGQWKHGLLVFQDMLQGMLEPDAMLLSAVVNVWEKGSRWRSSGRFLETIRQGAQLAHTIGYNAATIACAGSQAQWLARPPCAGSSWSRVSSATTPPSGPAQPGMVGGAPSSWGTSCAEGNAPWMWLSSEPWSAPAERAGSGRQRHALRATCSASSWRPIW